MLTRLCSPLPCAQGMSRGLHSDLRTYDSGVPEPEPTLGEVCKTIWAMRQQLTGGLAETIVQHTHEAEQSRQHMTCPTCECLLSARAPVRRTVETMGGGVELERPDFYCWVCRRGHY